MGSFSCILLMLFSIFDTAFFDVSFREDIASSSSLVWEEYNFEYEGSGSDSFILTPPEQLKVQPPKYDSIVVTTSITSRHASTSTVATYTNTGGHAQEISFSVALNRNALISGCTIIVDGVIYDGQVVPIQAGGDRENSDDNNDDTQEERPIPASKRVGNVFLIGLSIDSGSRVVFNVSYQEILERFKKSFEHSIEITSHLIANDFLFDWFLHEPQGIASIEGSWLDSETNDVAFQPGSDRARLTYRPSSKDLQDTSNSTRLELTILYSLRDIKSPILYTDGNYFIHYFSADGLTPISKYILFVVDISGSMADEKLRQTQAALVSILRSLRVEDMFNVQTFSNDVHKWRPNFVVASEGNVDSCVHFLMRLQAHGGSNIRNALLSAVGAFRGVGVSYRSILFLSDGVSTVGHTKPNIIIRSISRACEDKIALYCVGLGDDADLHFLSSLASINQGRYLHLALSSTASNRIEEFYDERLNPVLYSVRLKLNDGLTLNSTLIRKRYLGYVDGEEIIFAGKVADHSDISSLNISVSGYSDDGLVIIDKPLQLSSGSPVTIRARRSTSEGESLENIWAILRMEELSRKARITRSVPDRISATAELIQLSLAHSYVTPVTSLHIPTREKRGLASLNINKIEVPFKDQEIPIPQKLRQPSSYEQNLYGSAPIIIKQIREPVARVFGDPHFVIDIPGCNLTICFDVQRKQGTVLNLINDQVRGLRVYGEITEDPLVIGKANRTTSLFGQLEILLETGRIDITPLEILIDSRRSLSWMEHTTFSFGTVSLAVHDKENLTISLEGGVTMLIRRHPRIKHPTFFDFSLINGSYLSDLADGLIGKFYSNITAGNRNCEISSQQRGTILAYSHRRIPVKKRMNKMLPNSHCWHGVAEELIGRPIEHYIRPESISTR